MKDRDTAGEGIVTQPQQQDYYLIKWDELVLLRPDVADGLYKTTREKMQDAAFDAIRSRPYTPGPSDSPEALKDCKHCTCPCTHIGKESPFDIPCPEFRFGNSTKYWEPGNLIVREELLKNAAAMEAVLRQNSHKGTWKNCTLEYLFKRLREELAEAIEDYDEGNMQAVSRELLDVENFCMMFRDVQSLLQQQGGTNGREK